MRDIICFVNCFLIYVSPLPSVQAVDLSSQTELLPDYKVILVYSVTHYIATFKIKIVVKIVCFFIGCYSENQ